MNRVSRSIRVAAAACAVACALVVTGCVAQSTTGVTSEAEQNRQYMATLNQQVTDIQEDLTAFQDAVAKQDAVTMQAQLSSVDKVIESVKNTDCTSKLQPAKDLYVDALCSLDDALASYVSLYTDVANGTVDSATYDERLSSVQSAYNEAMDKLKSADDKIVSISNGEDSESHE